MKTIDTKKVTEALVKMCGEANFTLPEDVQCKVQNCEKNFVTEILCENLDIAKSEQVPICQDTGMAIVFADIGQDVHLTGALLEDAINEGVSRGYKENYLRLSVVKDPLRRVNTENNTPAIIHTRIVKGDKVTITIAPKGFGSENMSRLKMFLPSATPEEIGEFVTETVRIADSNPCPPVVVGVGIGGDFEYSAILAKKALCRSVDVRNPDSYYAELESEWLENINKLNIGAGGFGGKDTALAVNIETFGTHIAGLPVAVNIGCWVSRHKSVIIDGE